MAGRVLGFGSADASKRARSAGSTVTIAMAHRRRPTPAMMPSSRKPPKSVVSARKNTTAEPTAPLSVPGAIVMSAARTAVERGIVRRISLNRLTTCTP